VLRYCISKSHAKIYQVSLSCIARQYDTNINNNTSGMHHIWSRAGPVNRDYSCNKALIMALINIQNDISKLKRSFMDRKKFHYKKFIMASWAGLAHVNSPLGCIIGIIDIYYFYGIHSHATPSRFMSYFASLSGCSRVLKILESPWIGK
jgi:hypothetical protein